MKKSFLLGFILLLVFQANAHKFYTSITDINYNSNSNSLEIIMKFFIDDFELAIKEKYNQPISLSLDESDSLVEAYLDSGFKIFSKKKEYKSTYIGKEADKDYLWVYIEILNFKPKEENYIENKLLTEVFEDQTHQINFDFNSSMKTFTLSKGSPKAYLDIN